LTFRLHPAALDELEEQASWYEAQREGLGYELLAEAHGTMQRIADQPGLGAAWPLVPNVRRLALASFPFFLVYVVENGVLIVLAIAHTSRRPGYWRSRI
jgi:plasmid stabilization system protein ParE